MNESKKRDLLQSHKNNYVGDIFDAYNKPSRLKIRAWDAIVEEALELESLTEPKVNTFNTFNFTVSFEYLNEGVRHLRYYTSSNTYDFPIALKL